MNESTIRRVIVLGGGTAGWVAASLLARSFGPRIEIAVVESAEIGIVGVGEATIPPFIDFLRHLGIDEAAFIEATQATYKLGIVFENWTEPGARYWHPFGSFGFGVNGRPFAHVWHRAKAAGLKPRVTDHSLSAALGEAGRVRLADRGASNEAAGLRHALHFDAALIGRVLRDYAERAGVTRIEGKVAGVTRTSRGFVESLVLADGRKETADLFIDCSGFRGALIGDALNVPYLDWSRWLPVDRALAVPSARLDEPPPYTLSAAHGAGWRWRIPLQHRTGNGSVYCSDCLDDDTAAQALLAGLRGESPGEPRLLKFRTGRRQVFWDRNVVAVGLSAGFLEPLESTSIHLIISALYRLIDHFPDRGFDAANIAAYNATMAAEFESVRDFILLHYCLTPRRDTPFWCEMGRRDLPDSLRERIALYAGTGRIVPRPGELFTDLSWFYIFEGLGMTPRRYDPLADLPKLEDLSRLLQAQAGRVQALAAAAPFHAQYFAAQRPASRRAG